MDTKALITVEENDGLIPITGMLTLTHYRTGKSNSFSLLLQQVMFAI